MPSNTIREHYKRIALAIIKRRGRLNRPPPVRQPTQVQRDHLRDLLPRVDHAHELVRTIVLPQVSAEVERLRRRKNDGARTDDTGLDVEQLIEQVRIIYQRRYSEAEAASLAAKFASRAKSWSKEQVQSAFRKVLGVDAFGADPVLEEVLRLSIKENVALIKSIPSTYFDEIEKLSYDAIRTGAATDDLADQIEARYGVTQSRAQFIAIDQANKMAGAFTEIQHRSLGISGYIWRTTGDARVRDTHADLDGTRQSWDDPPVISPDGRRGHPGFDYRCRCQAEPDFLTLAGEGEDLDAFQAALAE
jgi:SPP1 gp7 family putative phage head morphogenesis protein